MPLLLLLLPFASDIDTTEKFVGGGALAIALLAIIFKFMLEWRKSDGTAKADTKAEKRTAVNGASGDHSTAYWQLEIASIVEKVVTRDVVPKLQEILKELEELREERPRR